MSLGGVAAGLTRVSSVKVGLADVLARMAVLREDINEVGGTPASPVSPATPLRGVLPPSVPAGAYLTGAEANYKTPTISVPRRLRPLVHW